MATKLIWIRDNRKKTERKRNNKVKNSNRKKKENEQNEKHVYRYNCVVEKNTSDLTKVVLNMFFNRVNQHFYQFK